MSSFSAADLRYLVHLKHEIITQPAAFANTTTGDIKVLIPIAFELVIAGEMDGGLFARAQVPCELFIIHVLADIAPSLLSVLVGHTRTKGQRPLLVGRGAVPAPFYADQQGTISLRPRRPRAPDSTEEGLRMASGEVYELWFRNHSKQQATLRGAFYFSSEPNPETDLASFIPAECGRIE